MTPWDLDLNLRDVALDWLYLSTLLLIGTGLRRYVPFFQKYLIPNALIGGAVGLLIGMQGLGWIDLEPARLGAYVYHLLALTFIALGLRQKRRAWTKAPVSKALASLCSYLIQGTIGVGVGLMLVYTIWPDFFVGMGLLVPLGLGMGPGVAYTMGQNWEQWGLTDGGEIGLTFSAIGFAFAFLGGMTLIHWGIRTGKSVLIRSVDHITPAMRKGLHDPTDQPIAGRLPLSTDAVEPFAFQLGLIGFVYLLTYWVVAGLALLLTQANLGVYVSTLWSFHFIIALLLALLVRSLLDRTQKGYLIDSGLMTRCMGVFLDYLIVGAVAAISLTVVAAYWLPIVVMAGLGGLATGLLLYRLCYRVFDDYPFERFIELFGEMTGTINSAVVLLRVTDPEFKTPIAEDTVNGSGIALGLGFPLLIVLNLPFTAFQNALYGYWITLGIFVGYMFILFLIWQMMGYFRD